jgi:hypothetical protein
MASGLDADCAAAGQRVAAYRLRGVHDGHAWLSSTAAPAAVREVTAGAELPDVGRILRVIRTSTGWMVETSQGMICQGQGGGPPAMDAVSPGPPPLPALTFHAAKGGWLRDALASWLPGQGYTLVWDAGDIDWPIDNPVDVAGPWPAVLADLLQAFRRAPVRPRAEVVPGAVRVFVGDGK